MGGADVFGMDSYFWGDDCHWYEEYSIVPDDGGEVGGVPTVTEHLLGCIYDAGPGPNIPVRDVSSPRGPRSGGPGTTGGTSITLSAPLPTVAWVDDPSLKFCMQNPVSIRTRDALRARPVTWVMWRVTVLPDAKRGGNRFPIPGGFGLYAGTAITPTGLEVAEGYVWCAAGVG